jgi:hypothetical protein
MVCGVCRVREIVRELAAQANLSEHCKGALVRALLTIGDGRAALRVIAKLGASKDLYELILGWCALQFVCV